MDRSVPLVVAATPNKGDGVLTRKLQFFVDGEWRDTESSEYMPVTNSSTGEVMAEAPKCTAAEVNEAVAAAAAAYPAWRDTPLPARVQVMCQFKQLVERELNELAVLLAKEMGKNLAEARGDDDGYIAWLSEHPDGYASGHRDRRT